MNNQEANQELLQKEHSMPSANQTGEKRRKRRSKHENEGRTHKCECGKSYLSQPALNNHKITKHQRLHGDNIEKRGRGRPRKYPLDNEQNKFAQFFNHPPHQKKEGENFNISDVIKLVFDDIYVNYKDSCYIHPAHFTDHPVLDMLFYEKPLTSEKNERKCDEVFYEYLKTVKDLTNKDYFILILKFVVLFRECLNLTKSHEAGGDEIANNGNMSRTEYSRIGVTEYLPDLCNEFVSDFLEGNNYFGITTESDRNELIEIIQHFCYWLFKNEYTKSKLSMSS